MINDYHLLLLGDNTALTTPRGDLESALKKTINQNLFSEIAGQLRRITEVRNTVKLSAQIINRGVTDESLVEIACRAGAREVLVEEEFIMPAGSFRPYVKLKDENGVPLRFASQQNLKFGRTTIAGVKGLFYASQDYFDMYHPVLVFGRYTYGQEVLVPEDEVVHISSFKQYKGYDMVLVFSDQDNMTEEEIEEAVSDIVKNQNTNNYVIAYVGEKDIAERLEALFPGHCTYRSSLRNESEYADFADEIYACLDRQGYWETLKEKKSEYLEELEWMSEESPELELIHQP